MSSLARPKGQSISSVSSASAVIEASAADLVLLKQSLGKSEKLSSKLGSMLTGFDDRLLKLEKSLAPIHRDTNSLTRIGSNIDETLRIVDRALGSHESALRQESVIKKGPRPDDISPYTVALDELVRASRDVSRRGPGSSASNHLTELIDTGGRKLATVFVGWLKDSTGAPLPDANAVLVEGRAFPSLPPARTTQLAGLLAYLKNLPGNTGKDLEADLQQQYADVRGTYLVESLRTVAEASTAAAKQGGGAGMFASYLDCLFEMAKAEHTSAGGVFRGPTLTSVYSRILPPSLTLLYETGQAVNAVIKRSLTSSVSVAFEAFEALRDRTDLFDGEIRTKSGRKDNELGELVHAFRGSCLRSLPEFIEDTKSFGTKPPSAADAVNTAIADTTKNVVRFMKEICLFSKSAEEFLATLGDGNWTFPPSGAGRRTSGGEQPPLLERYLIDVLTTLLNALEGRAKSLRLPSSLAASTHGPVGKTGPSAVFLMNNLSYVRRELLEATVSDHLGEQGQNDLNKRMRSAKAQYLEVWSPLISALMDAGDDKGGFGLGVVKSALPGQHGGAERREVKDRFGRFNDAFEEIETLHGYAKLERSEADMRERLRDEVERMVVPTYGKFAQRHEGGQFSKNPSKYLKMTVQDLEDKLNGMFA